MYGCRFRVHSNQRGKRSTNVTVQGGRGGHRRVRQNLTILHRPTPRVRCAEHIHGEFSLPERVAAIHMNFYIKRVDTGCTYLRASRRSEIFGVTARIYSESSERVYAPVQIVLRIWIRVGFQSVFDGE